MVIDVGTGDIDLNIRFIELNKEIKNDSHLLNMNVFESLSEQNKS